MHQYPTMLPGRTEAEGLEIRWQDGPIGPRFNGASVEVVIRAAIGRLEWFQSGPMACPENADAIAHLNLALADLDRRTRDRYQRGVMGKEVA